MSELVGWLVMWGKPQSSNSRDILAGALAVGGLLLVLYLLTFSGRFTSIDELAIYARAESLIQLGALDTPQLAFSEYHNPVGEIEAGYAILAAPFYWLAMQVSRFNNIQVVMILNPLLTAATGMVLYATARTLGYSHRGSSIAALAYGLTTLAWPYSRSLYREPLVGLGWIMGLYGLVLWRYRKRAVFAVIGGLLLVVTLTVKSTAIAAVPFIFLAVLAQVKNRQRLGRSSAILAMVFVTVAVLFQIVFTRRFGSAWNVDILAQWSLLTSLQRIYGQLASPGKGLIFYMPVVVMTVPGLYIMWRQHRPVGLAIGLPLLATAVAYSSYGSWYGGQSWGPRFLVPAVPLIMLAIAPLWDATKQRWLRGLYLAIMALSLMIQLGVVTANWWSGYKPLFDTGLDPEDNAGLQLANILLSPPLAQLRAWRIDVIDLLWFHPFRQEGQVFFSWLAMGLAAAVLAAVAVWWLVRSRGLPIVILTMPPTLALVVLLLLGPGATPGYPGLPVEQGKALAAWAGSRGVGPYTLVTMSNEFHIYFYLGFLKGRFVHHWYSPNQTDGFEPILEESLGEQVVLVMDRVHIDPTLSGKDLEWWLNQRLFRLESDWIGDYELVHYANLPAEDWIWHEVDYQFGDSFALTRFSASQTELWPGDTLGLQFTICRSGPLPDYHHFFTHLQGPGVQISGHDGSLRYGGTSMIPWEIGDCLIERRAIAIPTETQAGTYDIIVGFDTPAGLMPVQANRGTPTEFAVLGQVSINSRQEPAAEK